MSVGTSTVPLIESLTRLTPNSRSLTQRWYVREQFGVVVETRANPAVLNAGIALSLIAAVAANVALVLRFLERKPRAATLIAMLCLLVHDVINIIIVTAVGVIRSVDDGFVCFPLFFSHSFG